MKLYVWTQDYENYGDEAAPFWKAKGGEDIFVPVQSTQLPEGVVESIRERIEVDNPYFRSYIAGWHVVADDYLTDFERSQLEYDGKIIYPTRVLETA